MNNRRNAARRGLTKLGLLVILTALGLFGLVGYEVSSRDSNSSRAVAIASQSTSVTENQTDTEETHSEPEEEEVFGDPDPDTLRKPGDPVPRAKPGGLYTQQELDDMASSYDLSYEAEQRAQAEEKTQQASLPFTPQGSATMVGRWGRSMQGSIDGNDNSNALDSYAEYRFDGGGNFTIEGYGFGRPIKQRGVYRLDGGRLRINYLETFIDERWQSYGRVNLQEGVVYEKDGLQRLDIGINGAYYQGVWWDFNSEPPCYRYENGNKVNFAKSNPRKKLENQYGDWDGAANEPKENVLGLFPYDSGEFKIRAVLDASGRRIVKLVITPFHHFFGPQDGDDYRWESRIQVEAAEKWLAKRGVSKSIPREIKEE